MRLRYSLRVWLKRGRWFESAARSAFQRKIRAPCDLKKARNSSVKNEEPSGRGLNSSKRRPSGLRNRVRISLIKNFQSAGDHLSHSPLFVRVRGGKEAGWAVNGSSFR